MNAQNQNTNNNKNQKQNSQNNKQANNTQYYPKTEIKEDKNILVLALVWIIALLFWTLAITIYTQPKPEPLVKQINDLYNTNQDSWEEINEIKAIFNWKYRK